MIETDPGYSGGGRPAFGLHPALVVGLAPDLHYTDLQFAFNKTRRFGGADRDRTGDLRLAKPSLSQLSYSPDPEFRYQTSDSRLVVRRAAALSDI